MIILNVWNTHKVSNYLSIFYYIFLFYFILFYQAQFQFYQCSHKNFFLEKKERAKNIDIFIGIDIVFTSQDVNTFSAELENVCQKEKCAIMILAQCPKMGNGIITELLQNSKKCHFVFEAVTSTGKYLCFISLAIILTLV